MPETRPTGEQLRFVSALTGEHSLDAYLEQAEKGGRTLADLLDDLFAPSGTFKGDLFEFRVDPATFMLQTRVGVFADPDTGWVNTGQYVFRLRGTHTFPTAYSRLDSVEYLGELYICVANHTSNAAAPGPSFMKVLEKPNLGSTPILFSPDATHDIGASGASRPRHYFGSGDITAGGAISAGGAITSGGHLTALSTGAIRWGGRTQLTAPADGQLEARNSAGAAFADLRVARLQLANTSRILDLANGTLAFSNAAQDNFSMAVLGPTASNVYPALKRSAAEIHARLADDSADATFRAGAIYSSGSLVYRQSDNATAAQIRTGTATDKLFTPGNIYAALAPVEVAFATNQVLDFGAGVNFNIAAATAAFTLANPTNAKPGQSGRIRIPQDVNGGRLIAYGSAWKCAGGAQALSTSPNAIDCIDYLVNTTSDIEYSIRRDVKA